MKAQSTPSPVKPASQAQSKLPLVLVQVALSLQLSDASMHIIDVAALGPVVCESEIATALVG